jgi:hypothetical protein
VLELEELRRLRDAEGLNQLCGPAPWRPLIVSSFALAGLGLAATIIVVVVVVVFFDSGGGVGVGPGSGGHGGGVLVAPLISPITGSRGITVKSLSAAKVREGPDISDSELASLPSGRDVEVIGRNASASWMRRTIHQVPT